MYRNKLQKQEEAEKEINVKRQAKETGRGKRKRLMYRNKPQKQKEAEKEINVQGRKSSPQRRLQMENLDKGLTKPSRDTENQSATCRQISDAQGEETKPQKQEEAETWGRGRKGERKKPPR